MNAQLIKKKVAVLGASGYTGAELIRLLSSHPHTELTVVTANQHAGSMVSDLYPNLNGMRDLKFTEYVGPGSVSDAEIVFLALPHGVSMAIAPELLSVGKTVIDLSGDFRLQSSEMYEEWYGAQHTGPQLFGEAVYGLPEIKRSDIHGSKFITCPGCYPTSIILGLAPAVKAGIVKSGSIIADSKSGTSGAGRSLKYDLLFSEVASSFKAYAVGDHKHIPEIEQYLGEIGDIGSLQFTPHLLPIPRGILSTIVFDLDKKYINLSEPEIRNLYSEAYASEPFVKVFSAGKYPATKDTFGSNSCFIGIKKDVRTGRVIIISVIDNLLKGASGQAVQCFNILIDVDEATGLSSTGIYP